MRTKVTLVLLFLNLALFLFIFRVERNWATDRVAQEIRHRVLGSEAAAVRSLEVVSAGGAAFRAEVRGDHWVLTKPVEWRANTQAIAPLITDLQQLNDETSFSVRDLEHNGQSLADYGLDRPALTVTLVSGGPDTTGAPAVTTTLRIGNGKTGERVYLLSGDGARIHVVGRPLVEHLEGALAHLDSLRSEEVLTIPVFEARALTVQKPAAVLFVIRRDGGHWAFENPIPARANKDAVEMAINSLGALRLRRFAAAEGDLAPPDQFRLQVTIEGDGRRETLFLGAPVARQPGAAPAPAGECYAWREDLTKPSGRSAVFTVVVDPGLLEILNTPDELRDPHVLVDLDPATVTAIALQAPGQPELTLQRLDPRGAWQIILPGEAQGPRQSADPDAVQRLLTKLALLTARRFSDSPQASPQFSDAPSAKDLENWGLRRPERTVTLTVQPAAAQTILQIGRASPRDPVAYAKLETGTTVYAINPEILDPEVTPVDALAWRDRLVQSLPAAATITALRLTDLADGRVVLAWTPAAEAALAPAARAAAAAVRDQLRQLRVRRFVADRFPAAGDAAAPGRSWRYKLDATVSLPGGGSADQTSVHSLWIAERSGGTDQLAGAPEYGAVFALDQPMIDAIWDLTYGARDPGAPPAATR